MSAARTALGAWRCLRVALVTAALVLIVTGVV
ncbi:hypothetical protein B0I33_103504 [Prauserella shujinwangii]|uniref:Uncharacterized protein n=1 Tax=Prauserella shujinwangii TaxID=1453103 RepID=A0A2T0LZC3_9PSEU|nr:hypothetical protein B0I33_103504 [Prauserella shujinwangii]